VIISEISKEVGSYSGGGSSGRSWPYVYIHSFLLK
jgi:hypothetical protein